MFTNHNAATKAIKASLNAKAFAALMSKWQKLSAKGYTKLSFADWYKANKAAQVEALVNSWMTKAA